MKASVIVPTYNDLDFLKRALPKIIDQSFKDFEVIVVNDGSGKETEEYLELIKTQSKIKVINLEKNKGVCYARNIGLKTAKGEILVNMDADCIPTKTWLQELIQQFTNKEIGVVSSYGAFGGTSTAFRKSALEKHGYYDEDFGYYREDTDITFRLIEAGYKFKSIAKNFDHIHPEIVPKCFNHLIQYGFKRILLHQNDVLLWKKHRNKRCKRFLRMENNWLISPWWDFSVATGLWSEGGKLGLSSPRFNSPYNQTNTVFVECDSFKNFGLIILGGLAWVIAVKFGRLIGSIRFGVWLI